jgi:hypothetical protein
MSNNQDLINFQNKLYNETGTLSNDNSKYIYPSNSGKAEISILLDGSKDEEIGIHVLLSEEEEEEEDNSLQSVLDDDSMPPLLEDDEQNKKSVLNSKQNKVHPIGDGVKVIKKMTTDTSKISINNVEITTDGISHDVYSTLSFQNKMKIGKSIGFCEACNKYYPDFIVVEHDTMPYCWHCLFWLTSTNMFSNKELEQTYGLSLGKYIEFCGPIHNKDTCFRKDECILCNNCNINMLDSDNEDGKSPEDSEDLILELNI